MARHLNKLTYAKVKAAKAGKYIDGGGLQLVVDESGARRWVMRITLAGRRVERGLGAWPDVTLDTARARAGELRAAVAEGRDPFAERAHQRLLATTFEEAFRDFFIVKQKSLSNAKHLLQWPSTMETYVFPTIGQRPVSEITSGEIIAVLEPIWHDKPETAKRVLQRMKAVFDSATLRGSREKASPCIGVTQALGGTRHRKVQSHRALPYADVSSFIAHLHASHAQPLTKLAFEFLVLTAARSGEVRGAEWSEVDEKRALWRIPGSRMKGRREHIVPLSSRALDICRQARQVAHSDRLLFPTSRPGQPISDMTFTKLLRDLGYADRATAHGFRSSFRDWATELASVREVVAEACLAHAVADKTEAAYRRATYLDERREVMERWGDFLKPDPG